MIEFALTVSIVSLLIAASIWADKRFSDETRLPMQWSFTGEVNWTAPRRVALAFTPGIATFLLIAINVLIAVSGEPRRGQEGFGPLVILFGGVTLLTVHALHLWLIERSLRQPPDNER